MPRDRKFGILACCVLIAIVLPVTMLNGLSPARQHKAEKKAAPTKLQIKVPVALVEPRPASYAQPGSSEGQRYEAFVADVKAGKEPIASFGDLPKTSFLETLKLPDWTPTEIIPQKDAKGDLLSLQQKLATAFAEHDALPASRSNHFGWLKAHPNVRIFGWYGVIKASEVQPDSSVIVVIEFQVKTEMTRIRGLVRDSVTERYRVADGAFHLIDTDADFLDPARQTITPR